VPVSCPLSSGGHIDAGPYIKAQDADTFFWTTGATPLYAVTGLISTLGPLYPHTIEYYPADSFFDVLADVPSTSYDGYWYLLKPYCNNSYGSTARDTVLP